MPWRAHFSPPPFHENRPGLIGPVAVDPLGNTGPTARQARGVHWRRSSWGLHVPAIADRANVEQRIVEAAAVLPEVGGITGWGSLNWLGGSWFDGLTVGGRTELPVDLATCYQDIRSQAGYVVHQERLSPGELIVKDGLRTTSAARSVCFMMRYARNVREAVACGDLAMFSDLVSIAELTAYCLAHPGWTGIPQARDALPLLDENSWSPWETWARLVWRLDAGLPPPLCNRPVFDLSGHHIATPDFLDPESGCYGEYDGEIHLLGSRRSRDITRENDLRNLGLEGFTIVASDIAHPDRAVQKMTDARRRAKWEPESTRRWTTERPGWWTPTHTVDLRRQLTERQRVRFLRHRAS
jgi:hypothetical protein